jgi:hypothetical protein
MTAEELRVLATSIFDFVQLAVTEHPNTEPDVLLALLPSVIESWNEQQRADAIARHARTPAAAFRLLAERLPPILNRGRNHQFGLRAGIAFCCNPKTPIGDIEMLIRDTRVSTDFRQMLVREVTRLEVLHLLVTDRSIAVQKRAQARLQELSNIRND